MVHATGGYTHYREKTATAMGELAEHLREKYDGDATRLLDGTKDAVTKRVKEVKGIGPLGSEIFLETVQAVAPHLAPAMSKRNLETAQKLGLGGAEAIFKELDQDASLIAKLCQGLTIVRLEGN